MNDGIIKADGTSRLMRAELPATYEEFKAQAAAGTLPMDILFNAAGWTQLPTFLNKGALLKDITAAMFGLGSDAVPDDALAFLGKFNQHWWSRRQEQASVGYDEKQTIVTSEIYCFGSPATTSGSTSRIISYADSINIDQTAGTITLINPGTVTLQGGMSVSEAKQACDTLLGKYATNLSCDRDGNSISGNIYFIPDDTSFSIADDDGSVYEVWIPAAANLSPNGDQIYLVTAQVYNIPAGSKSYIHSADRNAYPDSGTSDGYEYEYLGVPFENAVGAPKIAVGSYVGTGTYGSDSPNSLAFDSNPLLLVILTNVPTIFAKGMEDAATQTSPGNGGYAAITWDEKTVSWYAKSGYWSGTSSSTSESPNARKQLNTADYVYHYAALLR